MLSFTHFLKEAALRVDTTQNASITELFPALAFNNNYKPTDINKFADWLRALKLSSPKAKTAFVTTSNVEAGAKVIETTSSMQAKFFKDKMNNGFSFFDAIQSTPIKNNKALKKSLMLLSMSHQYGRASLKLLKEYNINLKELITNKQEKIAAEAPIKMLFPLTFFILPVIFILLCSGAVLDFIKILE